MAQKIITENDIRKAIAKVLKEQFGGNVFAKLEEDINTKRREVESDIEALQNQLSQLEEVLPSLQNADNEIKERFPNIQGPRVDEYGNSFMYIFAEPLHYRDKNVDIDDIRTPDEIQGFFPESIRDTISVYLKSNENDADTLIGIEVSVDLDGLKGWN